MTEAELRMKPRRLPGGAGTLGEGHIAYVKRIRSEDVPGLFPKRRRSRRA